MQQFTQKTIFGIDLRNRKHLAIVIMVLFTIFVVGFTTLASFSYIHILTPRAVQTTSSTSAVTSSSTSAASGTATSTARRSGSELVGVDATWNRYISYAYGISILVPITAYNYAADCTMDNTGTLPSYRPEPANSAVRVYEDNPNSNFYLAFDSYAVLSNPTAQAGVTYFADCDKKQTTVDALKAGEVGGWKFYSATVNNEQEITSFIRSKYGASCDLGQITDTSTPGMKSVTVQDGGPDSNCWINFITAIYYSPTKKRIVAWDLGQAVTFASQSSNERAQDYDTDMRDSFRFID